MSDLNNETSYFTDDEDCQDSFSVIDESSLENSCETSDAPDMKQTKRNRKSNGKRISISNKTEIELSESDDFENVGRGHSGNRKSKQTAKSQLELEVTQGSCSSTPQSLNKCKLSKNQSSINVESDSEDDAGIISQKNRKLKIRRNIIDSDSDSCSKEESIIESSDLEQSLHSVHNDKREKNYMDYPNKPSFLVMSTGKKKTRGNVINSDSDSCSEKENIQSSNSEQSLHSICDSDGEVNRQIDDVTKKLNSSRISSEFNFGEKGSIINSTVLDIAADNIPKTPTISSKRSFNRSAETPRILKQMKESTTPRNTPLIRNSTSIQQNDPLLTPRNIKEVIQSRSPSPSSDDNSIEILSDIDDIIDVSSEDRETPVRVPPPIPVNNRVIKQTTLDSVIKKNLPQQSVKQEVSDTLKVSSKEFEDQKNKIKKIEMDLLKAHNLMRTVNMASLPDHGKLIRDRHVAIEQMLKLEAQKLSKMVVNKEDPAQVSVVDSRNKVLVSWEEIEAKASAVLPKTFGKQAMSTYNAQKAVTMDRLHQLHGSLESCPNEDTLAEDPKGLKIQLMLHQKRALAWLMWREKQKPSGGILADDMGLGKTLTMIALMLKTLEGSDDDEDSENENPQKVKAKPRGGTLVVCPASLIKQWSEELERRTRRGLASCELYHGSKRETNARKLAEHNMVVTTYSIVMNEYEKQGAIFRVKWRRIVIDEAHQIRNNKSRTSIAVCNLSAKSRWALTGTPVHNKELDMFALLKFLRCTPFDDIQVWKRWVGDKSTGGQERLHTVISSLMLRRTKAELIAKGSLNSMPERKWELISVNLSKSELDIYQRILIFSRTMFAQFLHQRAEKNQDVVDLKYSNSSNQVGGPNEEYFKMRQKLLRLNKVKDIKQHEILVLLLRLRQICCHPSLIVGMLHEDLEDLEEEGKHEELNLLDQLNKLALDDDEHNPNSSNPALNLGEQSDAPGLKEAARGLLNPSNPIFSKERMSSKIKVVLDVLKEKVLNTNDKAIIVSQWPTFLRLIAFHLKENGIQFDQLDGTIPVHKRMVMVNRFNDPHDKIKILLLSLTAGGVGLNLIGANYLFLLDLHWNPQLENQAQDRIYRVGQHKPVFVYKFMAVDTIEKRILDLQNQKLEIANAMLTGTKQVIGSKLSLQDLKMLFDM